MKLRDILPIAEKCRMVLSPFCVRIEIAGSVRRQNPECNDIELVCIPRPRDLFGFAAAVDRWERIKGQPTGRYTQRRHPSGMLLDLFMATRENWGNILAVRTGSARFAHEVLARGWCAKGYESRDGMLRVRGDPSAPAILVREEADLFTLLGIPWVDPVDRT